MQNLATVTRPPKKMLGDSMYTTFSCLKHVVLYFQNWNYFSDNEAECVKMMEEVEKLCDRLELARYAFFTYMLMFFDLQLSTRSEISFNNLFLVCSA